MKGALVAALLAISMGGAGQEERAAKDRAPSLPIPLLEQRIHDLINTERIQSQLPPLKLNERLSKIARDHSQDMASRRFFDHVNPDGQTSVERVAIAHRELIGTVDENIWMESGFDPSRERRLAETIVEKLLASPTHRGNLLKPDSTHLAIGVVSDGSDISMTQLVARIEGFTSAPVPETVKRGESLTFAVKALVPGAACSQFDLWSPQVGRRVLDSLPLSGARIDAVPGVYRVRFYCAEGAGRPVIYSGPRLEVRN